MKSKDTTIMPILAKKYSTNWNEALIVLFMLLYDESDLSIDS
jgi:hypothetical protein